MPEVVIPYKPRELQNFLHEKIDKSRFSVLVLHRRAGKTVMMINHLIRAALTNPLPNARYAFIAPTFKQGKATAWDYIKQFAGKIPGTKFNESELLYPQSSWAPKSSLMASYAYYRYGYYC